MRKLTFHRARDPKTGVERLAYLLQLTERCRIPSDHAAFILSIVHQYENRGLSWQKLLIAGLEGLRYSQAQHTNSPERLAQFVTWGIREHILKAIAAKSEMNERAAEE